MSPKDRIDVQELIEKARKKYPTANQDIIASLIRAENKIISNSADGKKLTRYLNKSFEIEQQLRGINVELQELKDKYLAKMEEIEKLSHKLKFADIYLEVIKLLETDEDFEKFSKFLEEIRDIKYKERCVEDYEAEQESKSKLMAENERN